jgi:hypothetical protein
LPVFDLFDSPSVGILTALDLLHHQLVSDHFGLQEVFDFVDRKRIAPLPYGFVEVVD